MPYTTSGSITPMWLSNRWAYCPLGTVIDRC